MKAGGAPAPLAPPLFFFFFLFGPSTELTTEGGTNSTSLLALRAPHLTVPLCRDEDEGRPRPHQSRGGSAGWHPPFSLPASFSPPPCRGTGDRRGNATLPPPPLSGLYPEAQARAHSLFLLHPFLFASRRRKERIIFPFSLDS